MTKYNPWGQPSAGAPKVSVHVWAGPAFSRGSQGVCVRACVCVCVCVRVCVCACTPWGQPSGAGCVVSVHLRVQVSRSGKLCTHLCGIKMNNEEYFKKYDLFGQPRRGNSYRHAVSLLSY